MNKIYLLLFFITNFCFSQLSNKHWIPPLHTRDETALNEQLLYLSTPSATPIQVSVTLGNGTPITGSPFTISRTLPLNISVGVSQPSNAFVDVSQVNTVISDKGFILESTEDFYVSLRMNAQNHAETLVSKGSQGIGKRFRLGSTPQGGDIIVRNFVSSVMATEDNTTVNLSDYNPAVIFVSSNGFVEDNAQTFTLNRGQSVVFSGYADVQDNWTGFIGALITSDKPVAVNTGNAHGGSTENGSDITLDQIVSADQIGDNYIFIRGNGIDETELPLIIADSDNTEIYINGDTNPITTINAGDYYVVPANLYQGTSHKNMFVRTSKPVFAYQLLAGDSSPATMGLNFIPPLSCFFQNSVYLPKITEIGSVNSYTSDLMILTYSNAAISINGAAISNTLSQSVVGNSDWVTYRLSGYSGNIIVESTGPLAVGVFGFSGFAGFAGYYSGFGSAPKDTDVKVCSSSTINLFDSINGNPELGGTWTIPAGGSPIQNNIFDPTINLPGQYNYNFTKACNTSLVSIDVKVNVAIVNAENVGNSATKEYCVNEASFDLTPLLGNTISTLGHWTPNLASGTSVFNPAIDQPGIYTYTIPAQDVCPQLVATVTLVKNELPIINAISDFELCDDNSDGNDNNGWTTFVLTQKTNEIIGTNNYTVKYYSSQNDAIANIGSINSIYSNNSIIYIRVINNTTGCYLLSQFNLKVNALPVLNSNVVLRQCDTNTDSITTFNLSEANGLISNQNDLIFTYFLSNNEATNNQNPITNFQQFVSGNNNTVWVKVTTNKGCYRITSIRLQVSATQIPSSYNFTLYACDNYRDNIDVDNDGFEYFDLNVATQDILDQFTQPQNITISYFQSEAEALQEINAIDLNSPNLFRNTIPYTQNIWVRIDSNINNDCLGLGEYVKLVVNQLPDFDLLEKDLLCLNAQNGSGAYSINATPTTLGSYRYNWTPSNPDLDVNGNQSSIFTTNQAGLYKVLVVNIVTLCEREDEFILEISSEPASLQLNLVSAPFSPGTSTIGATATGGYGVYEYSIDQVYWQDSPVFNDLIDGEYIVYARDKKECGIIASNALKTITYPNYFTPNGDSYNDRWNIKSMAGMYQGEISIFDRYGKLIKQISADDEGWDGTLNGKNLPSDDYWFVLKFIDNKTEKEFKSHFTLKR